MRKRDAEIKALKDAETKRLAQRQQKLTASASALKIGGPRDTTGVGKAKAKRKMGAGKTKKPLTPTVINPAGAAAGSYGGVPVL